MEFFFGQLPQAIHELLEIWIQRGPGFITSVHRCFPPRLTTRSCPLYTFRLSRPDVADQGHVPGLGQSQRQARR